MDKWINQKPQNHVFSLCVTELSKSVPHMVLQVVYFLFIEFLGDCSTDIYINTFPVSLFYTMLSDKTANAANSGSFKFKIGQIYSQNTIVVFSCSVFNV